MHRAVEEDAALPGVRAQEDIPQQVPPGVGTELCNPLGVSVAKRVWVWEGGTEG